MKRNRLVLLLVINARAERLSPFEFDSILVELGVEEPLWIEFPPCLSLWFPVSPLVRPQIGLVRARSAKHGFRYLKGYGPAADQYYFRLATESPTHDHPVAPMRFRPFLGSIGD